MNNKAMEAKIVNKKVEGYKAKRLNKIMMNLQIIFTVISFAFYVGSIWYDILLNWAYVSLILTFITMTYNTIKIYKKEKMALLYIIATIYLIWMLIK